MLRAVARWVARSRSMMEVLNAGWSQRATSAASNERENCCKIAMPVRTEEAMPSGQAGFSATSTG